MAEDYIRGGLHSTLFGRYAIVIRMNRIEQRQNSKGLVGVFYPAIPVHPASLLGMENSASDWNRTSDLGLHGMTASKPPPRLGENCPLLHKLVLCYCRAMPGERKNQFSLTRAALKHAAVRKDKCLSPTKRSHHVKCRF
jgi:hypothetical protein